MGARFPFIGPLMLKFLKKTLTERPVSLEFASPFLNFHSFWNRIIHFCA